MAGIYAALIFTALGLGVYTDSLNGELSSRTVTCIFIGLNIGFGLLFTAVERSARLDYAPVVIVLAWVGGAIALMTHDGEGVASEEERHKRIADLTEALAEAVIDKKDEDVVVVRKPADRQPLH